MIIIQVRAIVANKCDLEEKVSEDEVRRFANETKALFFKTSCKDNIGVQEAFIKIGQKVFQEFAAEELKKSTVEN